MSQSINTIESFDEFIKEFGISPIDVDMQILFGKIINVKILEFCECVFVIKLVTENVNFL